MPRCTASHYSKRSAMASYLLVVAMAALVGFCSLGVDYGRAQLAKTELRRAVDAAARYAASGIEDGTWLAKAQTAAQDNMVDGQHLSLATSEVAVGNFNSSLTPRFSTSRTPINAVQLEVTRSISMTWLSLLGVSNCTVSARAVAMLVAPVNEGVVGLDWIKLDSNAQTDSYDSSIAPYSAAWSPDRGSLTSNGDITLLSNVVVNGDAHPGPGRRVIGGTVTGDRTSLEATVSFPAPVASGPYNNSAIPTQYRPGNNFLLDSATYTLPSGRYNFVDFTLKNNAVLSVSGPVIIYVSGKLLIDGNARALADRPQNLSFRVTGSGDVGLIGNYDVHADIYAPRSNVLIDSNKHLYGGVVGKTLQIDSNTRIHVDESLARPDLRRISIVD